MDKVMDDLKVIVKEGQKIKKRRLRGGKRSILSELINEAGGAKKVEKKKEDKTLEKVPEVIGKENDKLNNDQKKEVKKVLSKKKSKKEVKLIPGQTKMTAYFKI